MHPGARARVWCHLASRARRRGRGSYIYGAGDCSTHRWIFKDSAVKQPQGMHLSEVLGALDDAEKGKREFGVIIDLR